MKRAKRKDLITWRVAAVRVPLCAAYAKPEDTAPLPEPMRHALEKLKTGAETR